MNVSCPRCSCLFEKVSPDLSGRPAHCEECGGDFIIPFSNGEALIAWIQSAPWDQVEEAVRTNIGQGHSQRTVRQLVEQFEQRRNQEIWRLEREEHGAALSSRERLWRAVDRREKRRQWIQESFAELLSLDPYAFEQFVADLFSRQGYRAVAVGGTADSGIDVEIRTESGTLWGIAQCKRYEREGRVRARDIRDFAGSYLISGAEVGFYFTTGSLTKDAKKTAKLMPWLTVYHSEKLLEYIKSVRREPATPPNQA